MRMWSHGYNVEVPYTYGYYRETSPLWAKWALYLGGKRFLAERNLRVLELGCGQGYNLCLHAAVFPEMEFLGIDFDPSHIAHAQELVRITGLRNIRFFEADFVELKDNWPKEYGVFHYVILHGIWSWISKPIREAVVEILRKVVVPGGVVYLSYNSLPGWLPGMILREVLHSYYKLSEKSALQALEEGFQILKFLEEADALIFRILPNLKGRLEALVKANKNYLVHEYLHETHNLFWVHQVMEELEPAKLQFVASATLTDNYLLSVLPEKVRDFINRFPHPGFRLFLIDLFANQTFRRDLFQKGIVTTSPTDHLRELMRVRFVCKEDPPKEYRFQVGGLEVSGKKEFYEPLMEELNKGERSLEELLRISPFKESGLPPLVQALTFLMSMDLIYMCNDGSNTKYAQGFNQRIVKLASEGAPYRFLASPKVGTGIPVSEMEMIIMSVLHEGPSNPEELATRALQRLKKQNRSLIKEGKPLNNPEEERKYMKELLTGFVNKKLKKLRELQVLP